jgi:hypothetical protein
MIATVEEQVIYQFPAGNERFYGPPEEGQEAWFDTVPGQPREFRRFTNGVWVPDPASVDNGP